MATTAPVSIDDYLRMSFEGPAPEYVDGQLVERDAGRFGYRAGRTRVRLGARLHDSLRSSGFTAAAGVFLRTGGRRVRIAGLAVFRPVLPQDEIPSTPPYLVAEIVSRDDRYLDILTKLAEYRQWGAEHVWLVDPWLRKLYVFDGRLREVDRLELPEIGLAAEPAEIFD